MNNFSTIVLCLNVLLLTSACNISSNTDNNTDKSLVNSCNSGKSCFSIGWKYEYGVQGYTKDYSKAIYFYQRACNFGNEQACNKNLNNNSSDSNISYEEQCSQGKGKYCSLLGRYYEKGENGYSKDYSKAIYFYQRACNLSNGEGCNSLANMYYNGRGTARDYQKASFYYNNACGLGYEEACNKNLNNNSSDSNISYEDQCSQGKVYYCFALGQYYANGQKGYTKNNTKSKYFFEKACDLNYGVGCYNLGLVYLNGLGVNKNKSSAKTYFDKACSLGRQEACDEISNNYSSGSNISHEEYCSQGKGEYCFSLGWSYANGKNGYTKDYSKAKSFYEKACNLDNGGGCNNLGVLYDYGNGVGQNQKVALYYFEKACKLNDEYGCSNSGYMYNDGRGTAQDYQKAKMYYNKACSLGLKESCNKNLNNNSSDSNISYEESCRRGNSSDCFTVGTFYEKGSNGYARNYLQAKTYYDKACTLRKSHGCHALGMLFVQGMGVNEDFSTARFYFKRACDLGKSESCILYGELQSSGY